MTYAAQNRVQDLTLGKLLKILSRGAVYPQLSSAGAMWKQIQVYNDGEAKGRESRYEVLTEYGAAAVQFTGYSSSAAFPEGQRATVVEAVGQFKDYDLTLEYDLSLEDKSGADLVAYSRPLALEMQAKSLVTARLLSAAVMGDGSGAIGVVGSVTISTSDYIDVTLTVTSASADRSHPGWFEYGDKVKFATDAAVAHATINNTATDVAYWKVTAVNQDTSVVRFAPYSSAHALINITTATAGATAPTAADYIYRIGITPNDLTAISTNDYNTISQALVGLPSLAAADGRLVNGLTMSAQLGGTVRDAGGALLSKKDFQRVLSQAKRRTGGMTDEKALTYSTAWMHDIDYDTLVEQNEANRQWFNVTDPNSGVTKIGHQQGKGLVEFDVSEFVPFQRIWILPDQKGPLSFIGHDFKDVKLGGSSQFLKTSATSGQYLKQGQSFMSGSGCMMARHPAAIVQIKNFTLTA